MKLSEDKGKSTFPANKHLYRVWTNEGEASFDLIALGNETIQGTIRVANQGENTNF
jgi:hypothetical protein